MKSLKNLKYEDLEVMSYSDIAELILKENGKEKSTADLFREICDLLKLPEKTFENKTVIIPTFIMKVCVTLSKIVPESIVSPIVFRIQNNKLKEK